MINMECIYEQVRIAENRASKNNKLRILARPDIFKTLTKDSLYGVSEYKGKAQLFGWELKECCMEEDIEIVEVLCDIGGIKMSDKDIEKSVQILINRYQGYKNNLGVECSETIPPKEIVAEYNLWNKVIEDLKQIISIKD